MSKPCLSAVLACMLFQLATREVLSQVPEVGQPLADFVLPRIDNREPVARNSLLGKPTVLIHFASW